MTMKINIISFDNKYAKDFYYLNIEWLKTFFYVEPYDEVVLSNPQHYIINKGGYIFFYKLNNEIVITFSDSGSGIPSHMLATVFEQYSTDKTNNPDGTGLGLYICKEIIEKHGGTISAENNQLGGALFTIKLPFLPPTITIPNSTQKSCNDSTCNIQN